MRTRPLSTVLPAAGLALLLLVVASSAPAAAQRDEAPPGRAATVEAGFAGAPASVDLGPEGSARVPVTLLLEVAGSGCSEPTAVPVAVGVEPTDGLRAALDRAEAVLEVPAGPGPHRVGETLALHVSGVGPGLVRVVARPLVSPESCLGLAGAPSQAEATLEVAAPAGAPQGQAEAGGTRPIRLAEGGPGPVRTFLLAGAAGVAVALLLRARPWKGA